MSYQQNELVDEYIAQFGGETKERLIWMRAAIQATFPKSFEDISYGLPTYRTAPEKRGIVHFGAAKDHVGLYAIFEPKANAHIQGKMKPYRTGKGTLQFKNDEPLPKHTIREILAHHASKIAM